MKIKDGIKKPSGRIPKSTRSGFSFKDKKRYTRKEKHKGGKYARY